ncbi:hypothetical protein D9M72_504100 [compost metagenome]
MGSGLPDVTGMTMLPLPPADEALTTAGATAVTERMATGERTTASSELQVSDPPTKASRAAPEFVNCTVNVAFSPSARVSTSGVTSAVIPETSTSAR